MHASTEPFVFKQKKWRRDYKKWRRDYESGGMITKIIMPPLQGKKHECG